ncbi:MAG TPA: enoyl-CoA hydratase [Acidimicrobiia bacterium]|jgi:2-(1,2-epoxy-1,2-dihydrophenyl)acetyl-CoA isomerase
METILVERDGGVVWATMNRPEKKNALSMAMAEELIALVAEVERRSGDRVLVLTGAGGSFSSGADLTDRDTAAGLAGPAGWIERIRRIHTLPLAIHRLPKPVVASVPGVAAGAGCNLALACDLVLASSDARFCEIFVRRGLSLDFGGSWLLPRLVGLQRAKELAFLGDMVDAARAEAIGLVNRVVAPDELEMVVRELAARLAAGPPVALAAMKQAMHQGMSLSLAETLEVEALSQTVCFSTADTAEAMKAFVERREPRFEGR